MNNKYDIAILGMRDHNYGNFLTSYALYQILTSMGKTVLMLDKPLTADWFPRNYSYETYQEIIHQVPYPPYAIAAPYPNKEAMKELNNRIELFLLPSDQVLRPSYVPSLDKYTLMDWVYDYKPKMAYASSFGVDFFDADDSLRAEMGFYLNRFDAISVREDSGIRFAKENFNLNVMQTLDPIFLCDKNIFTDMTRYSRCKLPQNPFLGGYILDPSENHKDIKNGIMDFYGYETYLFIPAAGTTTQDSSVDIDFFENAKTEDLITCCMNCDFFVTDSFHGICLSILFRKQFISVYNKSQNRGFARINDILRKFNLQDRNAETFETILQNNLLNQKIDYDKVYEILNTEIFRSREWLKDNLSWAVSLKKNKTLYDILGDKIENQKANTITIIKETSAFIWLLRKTKRFFVCLDENGFFYTSKLFVKKLKRLLLKVN